MTSSHRPPTPAPRLLAVGGLVGCATGALEVALRASPSHASSTSEVLRLIVVSMGAGGAVGSIAAALAGLLPRRREEVAAGLLGALLAVTTWRYEVALNAFLWEPRAWAGMLACGLVGAASGAALAPLLRRPHAPIAALVAAAGCVPVALARAHAPPEPPKAVARPGAPSFLMVTLDTVRRDRVPVYGGGAQMPHLARLAHEGVVFEDAVASAPITEPSHLAMFTGVSPLTSGVVSNGTVLADPPFVWRALHEAGWATAGFVSGFPLHGKWGWGAGFDVYDDDFGALAGLQRLTLVKAWNQVALRDHALRERPATQTLTRAVPWLRAHREAPTFTWVHLYDAHGPYTSAYNRELGPAPRGGARLPLPSFWPDSDRAITDASWLAKAYDNELRTVDDALGALLEALGPALEHTVVIVTSDHGEALGEHDTWFDHGDTLYDEALRVPLVLRLPEPSLAGRRVYCQVGLIDLAPTVAELAGVADGETREGRSLGAQLRGAPCPDNGEILATTVGGRLVEDPAVDRALRVASAATDRMKLIVRGDGARERYDLVADPEERANLAPDTLSEALYARLQSGATDRIVAPSTDPDTRDALEALGYVER